MRRSQSTSRRHRRNCSTRCWSSSASAAVVPAASPRPRHQRPANSGLGVFPSHPIDYWRETVPPKFEFSCHRCDVRTVVDVDVRELILDGGCVVCGVDVTVDAFSRTVE
ncbi:DUF7560 family zinc ribbon protein [Halomarina pelagica]|uniref:DUF7560 family zinc ribbon protein n=1 Tax=Halomarina pelagica TaxID=2961599 RepID=UPI003F605232